MMVKEKERKIESNEFFKPHKKNLLKEILKHRIFYLMLLPCIVFFFIFSYFPMSGLILSVKEYKFNAGIFGGKFVGLKYFNEFFKDPSSFTYIRNTLIISFIKLFIYLPFPIILALMFNEVRNDKWRGRFQSISYLPYFLSWVVVVGLMNRLLAPNSGLLNMLLAPTGFDSSRYIMMERGAFFPLVFLSYLWKNIGWDSIIYYAAIVGINQSLYEASAIDGASRLKQIRHVTIPGISSTIIILFILSLGSIMSSGFDQIYLLNNPGNAALSETIDTYIVRTGIQGGQFGYATAVGVIQGIIGLIATIVVNRITSKKYGTSLW